MSLTDTIITDAASASARDLCSAMARAFSDYAVPVNLTLPAFRFMMQQRGLTPAASRIAVVQDQIAAIWLVSVRANASYLIASGTVPDYRGRGLATALAQSSISDLRRQGVATFQTEVLVENATAARLYHKLGMRTHRDLSYYVINGPKPITTHDISAVPWPEISDKVHSLQDWPPSWQNSDAAINAVAGDVLCLCTHDTGGMTGYIALVPASGTVLQIGIRPDARRQGIGTALINQALAAADGPLRLINADAADAGFAAFVRSFPHEEIQGQHELLMRL